MQKYLCYIDILGFKNRIIENDFEKCYQYIINEVVKPFSSQDKVYLVSDSVVIISDTFERLIANVFGIYQIALGKGIFFRGAITKGEVKEPEMIKEEKNIVILPYLGKTYLEAYKLEASINTAAICIDEKIIKELNKKNKKFVFKFNEIFPKAKENNEKYFLISDMDNWSVPQTILSNISSQIKDISKHETEKFINTFCLYYKVMVEMHGDTNNLNTYNKWWVDILNNLSNTDITIEST